MSLNQSESSFTPVSGFRNFNVFEKKNELFNLNKKLVAFTLAEVLITLVIIGIVAALVIPNVVAKYKRKVVEVQLLKSYNTLFNAFQKAEESCGSVSGYDASFGYFKNCVIPNLKATKLSGKFKDNGYTDGIKYPNGKYIYKPDSIISDYKLDDGSVIGVSGSGITYSVNGRYVIDGSQRLAYQNISVDVNGPKGPNVIGKDIFYFQYINKDAKFVPQDIQASRALNQNNIRYLLVMQEEFDIGENPKGSKLQQNSLETIKNKCKAGDAYNAYDYCGAWIKLNGWKIPEDYPYL